MEKIIMINRLFSVKSVIGRIETEKVLNQTISMDVQRGSIQDMGKEI